MRVLDRALPILTGLGLLGAAAHVNIQYMGGYDSPQAIMLIAAVVGLGGGAVYVSRAGAQGRRAIGAMMLVALICGEAFALLSTAERVIAARDRQQEPLRIAAETRAKATERIEEAEAARAGITDNPRLERALAAHNAARAAVISESSKRTCSRTCIAALEQQAAEAAAEVKAARAESEMAMAEAEREVSEARATLAALPAVRRADSLAAILGWPVWAVDLTAAALASISVNILGALFIAFGAHEPRSRILTIGAQPSGISEPEPEPALSADRHAPLFMAERLKWSRDRHTPVAEIGEAYRTWARAKGIEALLPIEIGPRLSALFGDAGVPVTDIDGTRVAVGIALRPHELVKTA